MLELDEKIKKQDISESQDKEYLENSDLDTAIDHSLMTLPLDTEEQKLVAKIIEAPTKDDLQRQFDLFNINQSKKNALRVIKLNNLLSKVEDQAIERFEKRPDQVSNKELLDYMTVVSGQIDRAQKSVDSLNSSPAIHVSNQKNEVNINVGGDLDRDSKERVMDAIGALLKQVKKQSLNEDSAQVIEAEVVEHPNTKDNFSDEESNIENSEENENKLYNKNESEEKDSSQEENVEITFNTED